MNAGLDEYLTSQKVVAYEGGKNITSKVLLVSETSFQIKLNGQIFVDMQCMPKELKEMAVGFFVSEGILFEREELLKIDIDLDDKSINVIANIPDERIADVQNKMKVTSGCGRGITIDNIDQVMNCKRPFNLQMTLPALQAMNLGHQFNNLPGMYKETRCVHSAALSDGKNILYFSEDIGRHNAVDKVIGKAFLKQTNILEHILLCTGRFSFDMVAKAARVRIPLIISPAAATKEAILLASRFHIALCGRVRKNSMKIYSADWRIISD